MRASTHSFGNPDKPPRECGWRGMGRWGSALQHVFILHPPQYQALLVTLFGCMLARILSHTLPDACQHSLGHAWCICVPARIYLAIQTILRESVFKEEWDEGGARYSMGEYSTSLNLNQLSNALETLFGCVLARILSYTSSDACQHAFGHVWCICVPARIHLAIKTSFRESGWRGIGRRGSVL